MHFATAVIPDYALRHCGHSGLRAAPPLVIPEDRAAVYPGSRNTVGPVAWIGVVSALSAPLRSLRLESADPKGSLFVFSVAIRT